MRKWRQLWVAKAIEKLPSRLWWGVGVTFLIFAVDLIFVVVRPFYTAGRFNSAFLFLLAWVAASAVIVLPVGGIVLLAVNMIRDVRSKNFRFGVLSLLPIVFIVLAFLAVLSISHNERFPFVDGLKEWATENVDFDQMHQWRIDLERQEEIGNYSYLGESLWPDFVKEMAPTSVSPDVDPEGNFALTIRWYGGLRDTYGLTFVRPKTGEYDPLWMARTVVEVAPGVYAWWYSS
jgi:hypothetical protein